MIYLIRTDVNRLNIPQSRRYANQKCKICRKARSSPHSTRGMRPHRPNDRDVAFGNPDQFCNNKLKCDNRLVTFMFYEYGTVSLCKDNKKSVKALAT